MDGRRRAHWYVYRGTRGRKKAVKLHADYGWTYVEAPVFGRPEPVTAGDWPFPIPALLKQRTAPPVLTALGGSALFDMGEQLGVPTAIKQLGKVLILSAGRSLMERLAIAESAGVDAMAAVKMLTQTLFPSPIYRNYGKAIAEIAGTCSSSPGS